jgi:hypothetical protein
MTDWYFYPYKGLTGGADGALDSLDGDLLKDGDAAFIVDHVNRDTIVFSLDEDSGATEDGIYVIAPDSNAGDKRWLRTTNGGKFLQSGTGATPRTTLAKAREVLSVTDFGMSPSASAAANTTAFHAAVAAMSDGSCLEVPAGKYVVTNLIYNPPPYSTLRCMGEFESAAAGVAFTFGQASGTTTNVMLNCRVDNLKVRSATQDHTAGRVGVLIHNSSGSYIDIRAVYGFETGVKCWGEGAGVAYNEIHLGYITENKYSVVLTADATGWCNDNNFHSGALWWTEQDTSGFIHIWLDNCTNIVNNNRFYGTSLESVGNTGEGDTLGLYCEGWNNYFFMLRYEMHSADLKIELNVNSAYNVVFHGYGLPDTDAGIVTDNGTANQIWTSAGLSVAGASLLALRQSGVSAMTNVSAPSNLNADTVTVAELADIVGTLITKLRTHGLVGD